MGSSLLVLQYESWLLDAIDVGQRRKTVSVVIWDNGEWTAVLQCLGHSVIIVFLDIRVIELKYDSSLRGNP